MAREVGNHGAGHGLTTDFNRPFSGSFVNNVDPSTQKCHFSKLTNHTVAWLTLEFPLVDAALFLLPQLSQRCRRFHVSMSVIGAGIMLISAAMTVLGPFSADSGDPRAGSCVQEFDDMYVREDRNTFLLQQLLFLNSLAWTRLAEDHGPEVHRLLASLSPSSSIAVFIMGLG